MKTAAALAVLVASLCAAQEQKIIHRNSRSPAAADGLRCSNLSLVLDNWRFAIVTQVKDLLLHDHVTVLPDYGRIQPLSRALADLHQELDALKRRLAELTGRFGGVEAFVDQMRSGRKPAGPAGEGGARPPPRRRSRVVVRRIERPPG